MQTPKRSQVIELSPRGRLRNVAGQYHIDLSIWLPQLQHLCGQESQVCMSHSRLHLGEPYRYGLPFQDSHWVQFTSLGMEEAPVTKQQEQTNQLPSRVLLAKP